jgi:uncharacterized membrane protein YkvA (DUF1232 family)
VSTSEWLLGFGGVALALYALFVVVLVLAARREAARAVGGFIPDCVVLIRRLLTDGRVARRHKLLLGTLVGYLVSPIDIIPDFIPVAGQLDDAILVALALRVVLRNGARGLVHEHWPGPPASLAVILRLAGHTPDPSQTSQR